MTLLYDTIMIREIAVVLALKSVRLETNYLISLHAFRLEGKLFNYAPID